MALLLGLTGKCLAQSQRDVFETYPGTGTVTNLIVSSLTATQLDSGVSVMNKTTTGRRGVFEIWNDDGTNNLFCGFSVAVSSVAPTASVAAPYYGRRVPARSSWTVALSYQFPVYCIADAGSPVAVLTQLGAW